MIGVIIAERLNAVKRWWGYPTTSLYNFNHLIGQHLGFVAVAGEAALVIICYFW